MRILLKIIDIKTSMGLITYVLIKEVKATASFVFQEFVCIMKIVCSWPFI